MIDLFIYYFYTQDIDIIYIIIQYLPAVVARHIIAERTADTVKSFIAMFNISVEKRRPQWQLNKVKTKVFNRSFEEYVFFCSETSTYILPLMFT